MIFISLDNLDKRGDILLYSGGDLVKTMMSYSFVSLFFFIYLLVTPTEGHCGRYALVIGNGDYIDAPLKNPVNDARAMSDALDEVGFVVQRIKNATKKEMQRAVERFSSRLSQNDKAVFFYAGHAIQANNENYLLPLGVSIEEDINVEKSFIKVTDIINRMSKSDISIVVLDACRTNPFSNYYLQNNGVLTRSYRGIGVKPKVGLATKRAMGTLIAYSTDIGNVAYDGRNKNSVFTQNLVKYLKTPGLPVENVFKKVRVAVANATNRKQIPWDSSSITGDFYFVEPENKIKKIKPQKIYVPSI